MLKLARFARELRRGAVGAAAAPCCKGTKAGRRFSADGERDAMVGEKAREECRLEGGEGRCKKSFNDCRGCEDTISVEYSRWTHWGALCEGLCTATKRGGKFLPRMPYKKFLKTPIYHLIANGGNARIQI